MRSFPRQSLIAAIQMTDALSMLVTFMAFALVVATAVLWVGRRIWLGLVVVADALDKRWR